MAKGKIIGFIGKIKKNKRLMYLFILCLIVIFSLVLNVSFGLWSSNYSSNSANVKVNDLEYKMVINNVNLNNSVGTKAIYNTIIGDRIILLKSGKIEQFDINLTSLNNMNTKYEIIYKVCKDVNCTSFIDTPDLVDILINSDATDYVNGTIGSNKTKKISLITQNFEEDNYYVLIELNAGYAHNSLSLTNQISQYFGVSGTVGTGNISILAYVNGSRVENFPSSENYDTNVVCNDTSLNTSVKWNGTSWIVSVTNMSTAGILCKVYFTSNNTPAPDGWFTSSSGTLLYALRQDNPVGVSANTTGLIPSGASEKVLASASDDYGTSYYFRGNVQNNYIVFAGMCWRIVRVTGNGAIKITLYNRNDSAASNPCNVTANGTNAFAKYSGSNYKSAFNTFSGSDMWGHAQMVGYMYGTQDSTSDYATGHANNIDSTILGNLRTFYDSKLRSYNSKIADVIYCNDISGDGAMGYDTLFNARTRVSGYYGGGGYIPGGSGALLVCPRDYNGGKLSMFTSSETTYGNGALKKTNDYKIGLLTSDEVALAGSTLYPYFNDAAYYATSNKDYYLYENASGADWWLMSPFSHPYDNSQGSVARNFYVEGTSGLMKHDSVSVVKGVRPVIALVKGTKVTGSGTKSNPYVVS